MKLFGGMISWRANKQTTVTTSTTEAELLALSNADLVQRRIDSNGGAIAFVDDFTAWVTGPIAQSNRKGVESIIKAALDWERRSGATFEADKTAIIHFTRKDYKSDLGPYVKRRRV
jgi:hypothetical protein